MARHWGKKKDRPTQIGRSLGWLCQTTKISWIDPLGIVLFALAWHAFYIAVVLATSTKFDPSNKKLTTKVLAEVAPVASVPVLLKFDPKVSV